ncbi:MAG: hypothetical protein AAFX40_17940, partial [Cyanobacteria bacterium J06639_1]
MSNNDFDVSHFHFVEVWLDVKRDEVLNPANVGFMVKNSPTREETVSSTASANLDVSVLSISQATSATFTDLYFQYTFLFFIQVGSKRVLCPINGESIGQAGDVMIFSPGSMVTLENRPVLGKEYRATGVCFPGHAIAAVFSNKHLGSESAGIQIVRDRAGQSRQILDGIQATLNYSELPEPIKEHRLL